jgi:aminobenzoyl-glutamate utilization protein B
MKKKITIFGLAFCLIPFLLVRNAVAEAAKITAEKKTAIEWVDKLKSSHDDVAIYIWEHPELGFAEFKSAAKLQNYLVENGFKVEKGISGIETAFMARWGEGKPVIGFLGEFDALPNLSQEKGLTEERPIVEGAPGHGCGHNIYGASSATAAIATAKTMEKYGLKGTVVFYGTPGEEAGDAKVFMVRDGAWKDCDVALCWHPGSRNGVSYRTNLAIRTFKVRFHGRSAHAGGSPHLGRSALDAVELFDMGMNFMREHIPDNTRIHYVITKGGEAPNNVPPLAEAWYFMRAPHMPVIDDMYQWMQQIAEGAALMTQTKAEVKLESSCWEALPNKVLAKMGDLNVTLIGAPPFTAEDQEFGKEISLALEKMGIKGIVPPYYEISIDHPDTARTFPDVQREGSSADTGDVSWTVPLLSFGVATHAKQTIGHNWIQVTQNAMPPALKAGLTVSKWMAASALDLLKNAQIIKDAQKEHQEYLLRTPYHPVPADLKVPSFFEIYGREWKSIHKPPTYEN